MTKTIIEALKTLRVSAFPDEYDLHDEVARVLAEAGLEPNHEVRLAPGCRVDFTVGRVGIEVKKGRPVPSALRKQVIRYLKTDALDALIVVTRTAVDLPPTVGGKPLIQLSLNRLWGVALP
ncbi:MAG: hypothetical protein MJ099_01500 [Clostridia bacterium]|nr:hypothetical protein [Clostridia bacterium]